MSTTTSYITGYVTSILLTVGAFGALLLHINSHHSFPTHQTLTIIFISFAVLQILVQLLFFLHLGHKQKTHWNMVVLGFALFAVFVLIGGTLWIMQNLNEHMVQNMFINGQINAASEND